MPRLCRRRRAAAYAQIVKGHVAQIFDVPHEDLSSPTRRSRDIAFARQVAMYLTHTVFRISMAQTGAAFGRTRSTVTYACRQVEEAREETDIDEIVGALAVLLRLKKREILCAQARAIGGNEGVNDVPSVA